MYAWCLYAQVKLSNVDLSFYYFDFVLCYKLFINFQMNSETKSLYELLSPLENKDGT